MVQSATEGAVVELQDPLLMVDPVIEVYTVHVPYRRVLEQAITEHLDADPEVASRYRAPAGDEVSGLVDDDAVSQV